MTGPFVPGVGAVFSADIAVPDHEREVRFYKRVLSTGERPLWQAEDLMNNLGLPIIGLGAQGGEYAGLPLQWMPHIQVADVAASAAKAVELGGQELMHGKDDEGASQWAVLLDPNEAAFGIVPVVPQEAMPPIEGPAAADPAPAVGRIAWLDLTVAEAPATRDFYAQVVGWMPEDVDMEDEDGTYADFNMLDAGGRPAAGVCHLRGVNAGLPPAWMIYLPVGDLLESLRRVREGGGEVASMIDGEDGELQYAWIRDPVGVSLALMQG
jgi:uncharacterized protein